MVDAIAKIEELGGAASSQHILIAGKNGSRGLELSPRGAFYLNPDVDGILVHTNHFLANDTQDQPCLHQTFKCSSFQHTFGCDLQPGGRALA